MQRLSHSQKNHGQEIDGLDQLYKDIADYEHQAKLKLEALEKLAAEQDHQSSSESSQLHSSSSHSSFSKRSSYESPPPRNRLQTSAKTLAPNISTGNLFNAANNSLVNGMFPRPPRMSSAGKDEIESIPKRARRFSAFPAIDQQSFMNNNLLSGSPSAGNLLKFQSRSQVPRPNEVRDILGMSPIKQDTGEAAANLFHIPTSALFVPATLATPSEASQGFTVARSTTNVVPNNRDLVRMRRRVSVPSVASYPQLQPFKLPDLNEKQGSVDENEDFDDAISPSTEIPDGLIRPSNRVWNVMGKRDNHESFISTGSRSSLTRTDITDSSESRLLMQSSGSGSSKSVEVNKHRSALSAVVRQMMSKLRGKENGDENQTSIHDSQHQVQDDLSRRDSTESLESSDKNQKRKRSLENNKQSFYGMSTENLNEDSSPRRKDRLALTQALRAFWKSPKVPEPADSLNKPDTMLMDYNSDDEKEFHNGVDNTDKKMQNDLQYITPLPMPPNPDRQDIPAATSLKVHPSVPSLSFYPSLTFQRDHNSAGRTKTKKRKPAKAIAGGLLDNAAREQYGQKSIGQGSSFVYLVNQMFGAGLVSLPNVVRSAGYATCFLANGFICAVSAFGTLMILRCMTMISGNRNFERRLEYIAVVSHFITPFWSKLVECVFYLSVQSLNLVSIVVVAQAFDHLIFKLIGNSFALVLYPVPSFRLLDEAGLASIYEGGHGLTLAITIGYTINAALCIPLSNQTMEENMGIQYGSFAFLMFSVFQLVFEGIRKIIVAQKNSKEFQSLDQPSQDEPTGLSSDRKKEMGSFLNSTQMGSPDEYGDMDRIRDFEVGVPAFINSNNHASNHHRENGIIPESDYLPDNNFWTAKKQDADIKLKNSEFNSYPVLSPFAVQSRILHPMSQSKEVSFINSFNFENYNLYNHMNNDLSSSVALAFYPAKLVSKKLRSTHRTDPTSYRLLSSERRKRLTSFKLPAFLQSLSGSTLPRLLAAAAVVPPFLANFRPQFPSAFGSQEYGQLFSSFLATYSYVNVIPSWANEMSRDVKVSEAIWIASIFTCIAYYVFGLILATAYPNVNSDNILETILADSLTSSVTRCAVYVFDLLTVAPGILVYSIATRYNLINTGVAKTEAFVVGAVSPFLVAWLFSNDQHFSTFLTWSSLIFSLIVNFIAPFTCYLIACHRQRLASRNPLLKDIHGSMQKRLRNDVTGSGGEIPVPEPEHTTHRRRPTAVSAAVRRKLKSKKTVNDVLMGSHWPSSLSLTCPSLVFDTKTSPIGLLSPASGRRSRFASDFDVLIRSPLSITLPTHQDDLSSKSKALPPVTSTGSFLKPPTVHPRRSSSVEGSMFSSTAGSDMTTRSCPGRKRQRNYNKVGLNEMKENQKSKEGEAKGVHGWLKSAVVGLTKGIHKNKTSLTSSAAMTEATKNQSTEALKYQKCHFWDTPSGLRSASKRERRRSRKKHVAFQLGSPKVKLPSVNFTNALKSHPIEKRSNDYTSVVVVDKPIFPPLSPRFNLSPARKDIDNGTFQIEITTQSPRQRDKDERQDKAAQSVPFDSPTAKEQSQKSEWISNSKDETDKKKSEERIKSLSLSKSTHFNSQQFESGPKINSSNAITTFDASKSSGPYRRRPHTKSPTSDFLTLPEESSERAKRADSWAATEGAYSVDPDVQRTERWKYLRILSSGSWIVQMFGKDFDEDDDNDEDNNNNNSADNILSQRSSITVKGVGIPDYPHNANNHSHYEGGFRSLMNGTPEDRDEMRDNRIKDSSRLSNLQVPLLEEEEIYDPEGLPNSHEIDLRGKREDRRKVVFAESTKNSMSQEMTSGSHSQARWPFQVSANSSGFFKWTGKGFKHMKTLAEIRRDLLVKKEGTYATPINQLHKVSYPKCVSSTRSFAYGLNQSRSNLSCFTASVGGNSFESADRTGAMAYLSRGRSAGSLFFKRGRLDTLQPDQSNSLKSNTITETTVQGGLSPRSFTKPFDIFSRIGSGCVDQPVGVYGGTSNLNRGKSNKGGLLWMYSTSGPGRTGSMPTFALSAGLSKTARASHLPVHESDFDDDDDDENEKASGSAGPVLKDAEDAYECDEDILGEFHAVRIHVYPPGIFRKYHVETTTFLLLLLIFFCIVTGVSQLISDLHQLFGNS